MNGATIQVRLGKLGEITREYTLAADATAADLAKAAGVEMQGYKPNINNTAAEWTSRLTNGAIVVLTQAVKGGA